jgi:ribosomal protein L11 methyltransferase
MSFGTGHHATTFTVMQLMENLDFRGKSVYDFGTGTGILAILAEMLGASEVLAVDNDPWCIENSEENLQANGSSKITIQLVDAAFQPRDFDIIIANVNRHIIEANLEALSQVSNSTSTLILSGLLIENQDDIISLAHKNNWQFIQSQPLDGWVSLLFNKA